MYKRAYGRTDRRTDRLTDGRKDKRTARQEDRSRQRLLVKQADICQLPETDWLEGKWNERHENRKAGKQRQTSRASRMGR